MKSGIRQIPEGTTISARLMKPIDAEQSKPGDEVDAKTSAAVKAGGRVIIPTGTRLVGHIAEVKAKSDDERTSTVLVTFDKAIMKWGLKSPFVLPSQPSPAPRRARLPLMSYQGTWACPQKPWGVLRPPHVAAWAAAED